MQRNTSLPLILLLAIVLAYGCASPTATAQTTVSEAPAIPTASAPATIQATRDNERLRPTDGMVMVYVPGGIFEMGSTETEVEEAIQLCLEHYRPCNDWFYQRESPLHTAELGDYWIDKSEVTNEQYRKCAEAGACTEPLELTKGEPTYLDP